MLRGQHANKSSTAERSVGHGQGHYMREHQYGNSRRRCSYGRTAVVVAATLKNVSVLMLMVLPVIVAVAVPMTGQISVPIQADDMEMFMT